jgi:hypothetical protein
MKMNDFATWFLSVILAAFGFGCLAATNNPGTIYLSGSVPYDHDATNFIGRAGIDSHGLEAKAIGQLIHDLKAANLWTNFYALYPMVGSGSNSCAQNLVSTNYTVTWAGTNTFTAYGATGDGVSGVGDTHFIESSTGANSNNLIYYAYVQKHLTGSSGPFISAGQAGCEGGVGSSSANIGFEPLNANVQSLTITTGTGHVIAARNGTSVSYGLIWLASGLVSDIAFISNSVPSTGVITNSTKLLGNSGFNLPLSTYSKSTVSTAAVGRYLTYSQATNFCAIMSRFQKSLRRTTTIGTLTP